MITIALNPNSVVRTPIADWHDGENLKLAITRNGVVGTLILTISEREEGQETGNEAKFEFLQTGLDSFNILQSQLPAFREGVPKFYNIWTFANDELRVRAAGQITMKKAIRPSLVVGGGDPGTAQFITAENGEIITTDDGVPIEAA